MPGEADAALAGAEEILGDTEAVADGDGVGVGEFLGDTDGLRFFRGFGVGPAKNFFSLSPNVSSSAPRAKSPVAMAQVIAMKMSARSFIS
jgi:hypothetical protein